ncbi:MAG: FAD:protein FMN transferase [Casimicrobium sp.]
MPEREGFGFTFTAMASPCEIRLAGVALAEAERLAHAAIAEVRRIEAKYSRYRPDSVLSQINAAAGHMGDRIAVDDETAQLLNFAANLSAMSDGLFDCTSGVLRRAWDFKVARLPDQATLDALLPLVGWKHVVWDGQRIALTRSGMELDFGGFGKEYAVDRAATLLEASGVRHGLINLGGDVRAVGPQLDGSAWQIGIREPRDPGSASNDHNRCFASLPLIHGAIATSGDYERFIEVDGKRYCHILNPKTGWPVSHWRSVSVVGTVCVLAGALSTIAMLKGADAEDFLNSEDVSYLLNNSDGKVVRHDA